MVCRPRGYPDSMRSLLEWVRANTSGRLRRGVTATVGGSMVLAGAALLVLPGPGIPLLLAGLGVLSLEFAIARTWIEAIRRRAEGAGVPRRALWVLPAAGTALSLAMALAPAFLCVVHSPAGWTVVRKPHPGWGLVYESADALRERSAVDPEAAEVLRRSGLGPPAP